MRLTTSGAWGVLDIKDAGGGEGGDIDIDRSMML